MSKPVGIAVVGTGFMATTHLEAYQRLEQADLRYVVGRVAGSADEAAAKVGARPSVRLEDALDDAAVDVVDLCVPTPLHCDLALAALQAGKHVIVEKPLALDLDSADRMIEAARQAGRSLMVAHVVRFWPAYEHVAEVLRSGRLGAPLLARSYRLTSPPTWASWLADPQKTGGAAVDLGIHDLDILNLLFGSPRSVDAWGRRSENGAWSHYNARLEYGSVTAIAEASMAMPTSFPFTAGLQVHCEGGSVEHRFRAGGASFEEGEAEDETVVYREGEAPERMTIDPRDPFVRQLGYFLRCIERGEGPIRVPPADARLALETALAINRSLNSAAPVELASALPSS